MLLGARREGLKGMKCVGAQIMDNCMRLLPWWGVIELESSLERWSGRCRRSAAKARWLLTRELRGEQRRAVAYECGLVEWR